MRRLREFVRRHKTRKEESQASSEPPPLPSLPRPPDVHPAARDVSPQDQSLFFRLPTELRMKILHTAFGDRTIHIDFRFRAPLHTYETSGGHEPVHGGYPPLAEYFPSPRKWEPKPRGAPAWRWWSCVCHSSMPHDYKARCDLTLFGSFDGTDEVQQRARFAEYLDLMPRAFPKLAHLQLDLGPETYNGTVPPWDCLEEIEDIILKPLLEMSNKMKRLRDFSVLMSQCLTCDFFSSKAREESLLAVVNKDGLSGKVWYPFTAKLEGGEQPGKGYWIEEGHPGTYGWRPDGRRE
ncbi:hypothetical protein SAPIO_CDS5826 [Scedosporium apiospermum]|uniref:Uncharacterized protein n=1 Tax=Pseudallescheria apiosperma TaxID=563466 RepID=A0A084G5H8_PSEDA|nr:uncharacterized protein SAPIO_CDS5826 [Scedosporium apiospermum]KEZ42590.1 hypothetical protein SAPIO_CDS5826 [Scedosporium apiospermum]